MNALLIYAIKTGLYLAAFYLVYSLLLSRDTSYSRNRAFIIISMTVALVLPNFTLQNVNTPGILFFGKSLSGVLVSASSEGEGSLLSGLKGISTLNIIFLVYLIGVAIFGLKLISDLVNLLILILRKKNKDGNIIRFHGFNTAGFSAMGYVFINSRLSPDEASEIIKHEQNHLKRNHFWDIIFVGMVRAFQWFNPAAHLFNKSLRAIHEYQADEECLTSGIPVVSYQTLLLNQVFKTNSFTLSNSFSNPSLIRKRMIMMTKKRTSSLASTKLLFAIPVIGIVFIFVSAFGKITTVSSEEKVLKPDNASEIPYVQVEKMPVFPGGDEALLKFIASNTTYPENAKMNRIQGKVVLRFCVNANGKVDRISVIKSVDPDLDAEAIRVAGILPTFEPGQNGGRAVPVWYMVPITFYLK
jgi:TonB family protein